MGRALPTHPLRARELVLVPFSGPAALLMATLEPLAEWTMGTRVVAVTSSWAEARAARAALKARASDVAIEQGDPHHLSDRWHDAAVAVLAPHTLSTLARPGEALVDWALCLREGGVLGVLHSRAPLPHLPASLGAGLDLVEGGARWLVAQDERVGTFAMRSRAFD